MAIRADDVPEEAQPQDNVAMRRLVRADRHGADVSVTWVRLTGPHRRLHTDRSTRVYYVLEGEASFELGDDPAVVVGAGDVVVIPSGTPYAFSGELAYLVVNAPAFRDGDDVYECGSS